VAGYTLLRRLGTFHVEARLGGVGLSLVPALRVLLDVELDGWSALFERTLDE
jgi:hypothetical protein